MAIALATQAVDWTVADIFDRFGPIALRRIRTDPPPGSATEQDVIDIHDREKRCYELVDGVLVEKTMGLQESFLTVVIIKILGEYVSRHQLGFILGPDGMARLAPGLVRIPDVSLVLWDQFPNRRVPRIPMLNFAPVLTVEVLSPSNTRLEMDRKLRDYFAAGVRLVWYVDPPARRIQTFTAVDQSNLLGDEETLTGGTVLPGFAVTLRELFAELEA